MDAEVGSAAPASSQQAAGVSDREHRYAHLLEPIRDLATNWHIDLAGELEEYLQELDHIRIAFEPAQSQSQSQQWSQGTTGADGHSKGLNFAQAALLIQGSACIYSKKVEYLYALLYQTLDVLIDKRKSKQAASSINAQGDDLDALLFAQTDGALLDLDDTLASSAGKAKAIELQEEDDDHPEGDLENTTAGAAKWSGDMPAQRRQDTLLIRAPLSLLSDNLYDDAPAGGGKDSTAHAQASLANQFKLSACVMHPSGALLVEEREATLLKNNDRLELDTQLLRATGATPSTPAAANLPFGSPRAIMLAGMHSANKEAGIQQLTFDDADGAGGGGGGGDDMFGGGGGLDSSEFIGGGGGSFAEDDDEENEQMEHKYDGPEDAAHPSHTHKKSVRFAEELGEGGGDDSNTASIGARSSARQLSLEDDNLWSQLDPHDDSTIKPRPFRKGQTVRKPHAIGAGAAAAEELLKDWSSSHSPHLFHSMADHATNLAAAIVMRGIAKGSIAAPYFAEFSTLFLKEQDRRRRAKRRRAMIGTANLKKSAAQSAMRKTGEASASSLASSEGFLGAGGLHDQDEDDQADSMGGGGGGGGGGGEDEFAGGSGFGGGGDDDLPAFQLLDDGGGLGGLDGVDQWDSAGAASGVRDFTGEASAASTGGVDASLAALDQTYEELCRQHVAAYLASASQYLTSSTLSRRVLEWQERVGPLLDEEEAHPPYDIQACGRTLLHAVDDAVKKDHPLDGSVDFQTAVQGRPQWEVCRMFLAVLQLANNGNLELEPSIRPNAPAAAAASAAGARVSPSGGASLSLRLLSMADKNLEGLKDVDFAQTTRATATAAAADGAASAATSAPAAKKPRKAGKRKQQQQPEAEPEEEALSSEEKMQDENDLPLSSATGGASSAAGGHDGDLPSKSAGVGASKKSSKVPLERAQDGNRRATRRTAV